MAEEYESSETARKRKPLKRRVCTFIFQFYFTLQGISAGLNQTLKEQVWGHSTQSLSRAQLSYCLQNKVPLRVPRRVSLSNVIAPSHQKDIYLQHLPGTAGPAPSLCPSSHAAPRCLRWLWRCRIPLATSGTGNDPQQPGRRPGERPAQGTAPLQSRHSEPAPGNSPWPVLSPSAETASVEQFPSLNR